MSESGIVSQVGVIATGAVVLALAAVGGMSLIARGRARHHDGEIARQSIRHQLPVIVGALVLAAVAIACGLLLLRS
jgi:hypothetical protein